MAKHCGLKTIGEAVDNIEHHAMSIFKYEDINQELNEMYNDPLWDEKELSRMDSIMMILEDEDA